MTIEEALSAIKNAVYGKDVRQAMHDGILQAEGGAGTVAKEAEKSAKEAEKSAKESEIASRAIEGKADQAVTMARSANSKSDSTQLQLDEIVINGDSSVEAAQARVDIKNISYATLKDRLDKENQEVTAHLAHTDVKLADYIQRSEVELKLERKKEALFNFVSDDGCIQDLTHFKPLFDTYGWKFTMAIQTQYVGGRDKYNRQIMTWEQIYSMYSEGFPVESHTVSHPRLSQLLESEIEHELSESKKQLISRGYDARHLFLPYGDRDVRVDEIASKHYLTTSTVLPNTIKNGDNKMQLPRVSVQARSMDQLKGYVDSAIENNEAVTFMLHGYEVDEVPNFMTKLEELLDYLVLKNANVVDFKDVYDFYIREKDAEYIYNTKPLTDEEITATTSVYDFPLNKVTVTEIAEGEKGFPSNLGGILITHRIGNGWNWRQEFIVSPQKNGYKQQVHERYVQNTGAWTSFTNTNEAVNLSNSSWTGELNLRKLSDGLVSISGRLVVGQYGEGTLVGNIPVGFRPSHSTTLPALKNTGLNPPSKALTGMFISPGGGIYIQGSNIVGSITTGDTVSINYIYSM